MHNAANRVTVDLLDHTKAVPAGRPVSGRVLDIEPEGGYASLQKRWQHGGWKMILITHNLFPRIRRAIDSKRSCMARQLLLNLLQLD